MGFSITGKVDGLKPLMLTMDRLKRGPKNRILRKMVNRGSAIESKAMKAKAPLWSSIGDSTLAARARGILRKSIGVKVVSYAKAVVGLVGCRTGFKTQIGVRKRGKNIGQPVYFSPEKVAHLIEFGHGGPHPAPPHPFARPSWDENRSRIQSEMADIAAREIADLARG
jgi:HK97 gp10 family phage protein